MNECILNKCGHAESDGLDRLVQWRSLVWAFAVRGGDQWIFSNKLETIIEDHDRTALLHSLIMAFAGYIRYKGSISFEV